MTFDQFIIAVDRRYKQPGSAERYGQAFFNELYRVRPELANEIRGTNLDPFYAGTGPELYLFLAERW